MASNQPTGFVKQLFVGPTLEPSAASTPLTSPGNGDNRPKPSGIESGSNLDPQALQATYDSVVAAKTKTLQQLKTAITGQILIQEKLMATIGALAFEVEELEQKRKGATLRDRYAADELTANGHTHRQIRENLAASDDFTWRLEEKRRRLDELQAEVDSIGTQIAKQKAEMRRLNREVDSLQDERDAAVLDLITARERREINDLVSDVEQEAKYTQLAEIRELRQRAKAQVRISTELDYPPCEEEADSPAVAPTKPPVRLRLSTRLRSLQAIPSHQTRHSEPKSRLLLTSRPLIGLLGVSLAGVLLAIVWFSTRETDEFAAKPQNRTAPQWTSEAKTSWTDANAEIEPSLFTRPVQQDPDDAQSPPPKSGRIQLGDPQGERTAAGATSPRK